MIILVLSAFKNMCFCQSEILEIVFLNVRCCRPEWVNVFIEYVLRCNGCLSYIR